MEFSQDLLLGPLGALVAAMGAVVWLVRTWRAEVAQLRAEIRCEQEKLMAEHDARLADAKATTEVMMALNDRSHDVIRKLWEMYRQKNPPSPSKPPG